MHVWRKCVQLWDREQHDHRGIFAPLVRSQYTTLSWPRSVRHTTHIVQPLNVSSCGPSQTTKELLGEKMTSPSRGIELYHFTKRPVRDLMRKITPPRPSDNANFMAVAVPFDALGTPR